MVEFDILKQIGATSSSNEKIAILKANDTMRMRRLLLLTYNRFWTYGVKKVDYPVGPLNTVQPDVLDELEMLLMMLAKREATGNAAKGLIKRLLAKCTPEGAAWVEKIITRDLKIGIDEGSINKAYPKLVPVFDVQLALPIYKGGKTPKNLWPTLQYPVAVEEKLDGKRIVAICRDGKVTLYSRDGFEQIDHGVLEEQILKLRPGTDFVLDGEIIAKKFNPDHDVFLKYKDGNWAFEGGKSLSKKSTPEEFREYLGYYVWDIIELDFFESQGAKGKALPLDERKLSLTALFERIEKPFENLFLVPNALAKNEAEVKALFNRVINKGGHKYSVVNMKGVEVTYTMPKGEGVMVKKLKRPYEFKRSDAVLKVKEFFSMDLRIVGAYEGEKGSKYEGMLGGIELASDCGTIKTDCGSGFDDGQRFELWMRHLAGKLVGGIVEVTGFEVTEDGSLRFPVFQRERDDRTTTSVEG